MFGFEKYLYLTVFCTSYEEKSNQFLICMGRFEVLQQTFQTQLRELEFIKLYKNGSNFKIYVFLDFFCSCTF